MTAHERMAIARVEPPTQAQWIDHLCAQYTHAWGYIAPNEPARGQRVGVTSAMVRERGWCVDLFLAPRFPEDRDRFPRDSWFPAEGWGLQLDVTNTALAQAFGEQSLFTDDRLVDLEGEVERGTAFWHPSLPPNTGVFRNTWNSEWYAQTLTGGGLGRYQFDPELPVRERGWVLLRDMTEAQRQQRDGDAYFDPTTPEGMD